MPKFRIKETDATGLNLSSGTSNVVYFPFLAATDYGADPKLCSSIGELTGSSTSYIASDSELVGGVKGLKIAKTLINSGFKLLAHKILKSTATEGVYTGYQTALTLIEDKINYDVRFLTLGDFDLVADTTQTPATYSNERWNIAPYVITCAKNRGDCCAIIDIVENSNASFGGTSFSYDNVSTIFRNLFSGYSAVGETQASAFTPQFSYVDPTSGDSITNTYAGFGYLFAYANSVFNNNNSECFATAGYLRGRIPGTTTLNYEYSMSEINVLQGRGNTDTLDDNSLIAINPIAHIGEDGIEIFGNRTMLKPVNNNLVAGSFLNVRNMVNSIKKRIYEACKRYAFEQNTEILWSNFQSFIRPVLDEFQNSGGLAAYGFVRKKVDKKGRLKARINIVPIEAVEDFDLEIYMTDETAAISG